MSEKPEEAPAVEEPVEDDLVSSADEQAAEPISTPDVPAPDVAAPGEPANKDEPAKETDAKPKRRWLRWLAYGALTLLVLTGMASGLVWWSVSEHKRIMVDGYVDTGIHKQRLFEHEMLGKKHHQYRAPALITTPKGSLLAIAEGRQSKDDFRGLSLVSRRSEDGGKTWSDLVTVRSEGKASTGNPTPVVDRKTGVIFLVYRRTYNQNRRWISDVYFIKSEDDGHTWSKQINLSKVANKPKTLRARLVAPGPGHGIQLTRGKHAGRLIVSSYIGTDSKSSTRNFKAGKAQAIYSDDHGETWTFSEPTDYGGESQIVETESGDLFMIIRTRGHKTTKRTKRYAWSRDGGSTWEKTIESDIAEPVCHATVIEHPKGTRDGKPAIMMIQPGHRAKSRWDKSSRRDLTVWVSKDGAKTWPLTKLIHSGGASYSDATIGPNGLVHVVYEVGIKEKPWGGAVTYARFGMEWLDESLDGYSEPFSEDVYELYQRVRAPLEDLWHSE